MDINAILSGVATLQGKKKGERRKMAEAVEAIAEKYGATAHKTEDPGQGITMLSVEHPSGLTTSCMIAKPIRAHRGEWMCMSWAARSGFEQDPIQMSRRLLAATPATGYLPRQNKCTILTDGFASWCKELARGLALAERGQAVEPREA